MTRNTDQTEAWGKRDYTFDRHAFDVWLAPNQTQEGDHCPRCDEELSPGEICRCDRMTGRKR